MGMGMRWMPSIEWREALWAQQHINMSGSNKGSRTVPIASYTV